LGGFVAKGASIHTFIEDILDGIEPFFEGGEMISEGGENAENEEEDSDTHRLL